MPDSLIFRFKPIHVKEISFRNGFELRQDEPNEFDRSYSL